MPTNFCLYENIDLDRIKQMVRNAYELGRLNPESCFDDKITFSSIETTRFSEKVSSDKQTKEIEDMIRSMFKGNKE